MTSARTEDTSIRLVFTSYTVRGRDSIDIEKGDAMRGMFGGGNYSMTLF